MGAQRCRRAIGRVVEGVRGVFMVIVGTLALLVLAHLDDAEDGGLLGADW